MSNSRHITLHDILHSAARNSTTISTSISSPNSIISNINHHLCTDTFEINDSSADLPLPSGWEKCLDMETGRIYYRHRDTGSRSFTDPRIMTSANYLNIASLSSSEASPASDSIALSMSSTISSSNPHDNIYKFAEKADTLIDLDLSLSLGSNTCNASGLQNSHANRCVLKSTTLTSSAMPALKYEDGHLVYGSNNGAIGAEAPNLYNKINQSTIITGNNPMVTMGCLNCFMFVVIPRGSQHKCPSCGMLLNLNLESKLDFPL